MPHTPIIVLMLSKAKLNRNVFSQCMRDHVLVPKISEWKEKSKAIPQTPVQELVKVFSKCENR